jgi:hypothetical protein
MAFRLREDGSRRLREDAGFRLLEGTVEVEVEVEVVGGGRRRHRYEPDDDFVKIIPWSREREQREREKREEREQRDRERAAQEALPAQVIEPEPELPPADPAIDLRPRGEFVNLTVQPEPEPEPEPELPRPTPQDIINKIKRDALAFAEQRSEKERNTHEAQANRLANLSTKAGRHAAIQEEDELILLLLLGM